MAIVCGDTSLASPSFRPDTFDWPCIAVQPPPYRRCAVGTDFGCALAHKQTFCLAFCMRAVAIAIDSCCTRVAADAAAADAVDACSHLLPWPCVRWRPY